MHSRYQARSWRIRLGIFAAALGATGWAWGCGVKSAPIPPELARPEKIVDLRAGADRSGIKLDWGRPAHYASGHTMRDLADFVILRGEGDSAMQPLVKLPVTDQERFSPQRDFTYVDGETTLGSRYRYAIVSETSDGYTSEASNEVDFTRIKPPPPPNPDTFALPAPSPFPDNTP